MLVGAGCTRAPNPPSEPDRPRGERALEDCGPPDFDQVRGRAPRYLDRRLDTFANDQALCGGLWLPRAQADFTPQGLAMQGRTAFVSGYDGAGGVGTRFCRVQKVDVGSGRLLVEVGQVQGTVGSREPVACRHGGGLLLDRHGLWLVETDRLWLLDPDSLAVERVWALVDPVRGSFAVHDDAGRLGLGGFQRGGRARLYWFDPTDLLATDLLDLTEQGSADSQPAPTWAQGALWGDLGPGPPGVWFATSTTYCGVLVGPGGVRKGFLPGVEGIDRTSERTLWALSESATRPYQLEGGRPVVPMLARFDLSSGISDWARPDCTTG